MEKIIVIEPHLAVGIYGKNNRNIDLLRNIYPTLKLTARGNELKVAGTDEEVATFETRFELLTAFYDHFERLTETDIINITANEDEHFFLLDKEQAGSDIILHGREGKVIKALTPNQKKLVKSLEQNDMVFAIGPAGTGKTYTSVALAVRALKNKQIKRIILTRPAVEAGENLGFLPGDMRDKLDPYLQPLYDALRDMMPMAKLVAYLEDKTIEIAPLAFMRGRTLDNAYVILDEAQNATESQLKMFLTRMGKNAKFFITGDITQVDLPKHQHSGLIQAGKILQGIKGIEFIHLDNSDVVRHHLVTKIIQRYENWENERVEKKKAESEKKTDNNTGENNEI